MKKFRLTRKIKKKLKKDLWNVTDKKLECYGSRNDNR